MVGGPPVGNLVGGHEVVGGQAGAGGRTVVARRGAGGRAVGARECGCGGSDLIGGRCWDQGGMVEIAWQEREVISWVGAGCRAAGTCSRKSIGYLPCTHAAPSTSDSPNVGS